MSRSIGMCESDNSYSIATIFGEDTDDFNKPKIIGLDQRFSKVTKRQLYKFFSSAGRVTVSFSNH